MKTFNDVLMANRMESNEDIEESATYLQGFLSEALNTWVPKTKSRKIHQPWCNQEVEHQKQKANRFKKIWILKQDQTAYVNFKTALASYRTEIRTPTRYYNRRNLACLPLAETSRMYNRLTQIKEPRTIETLQDDQGNLSQTEPDKLTLLAQKLVHGALLRPPELKTLETHDFDTPPEITENELKSVIHAAAKALSRSSLVASTMRKCLDLIDQKKSITLAGVPGHAGVPGNAIADKTVKQAITHPAVDYNNPPSFESVKSSLKIEFLEIWNQLWNVPLDII